MSNTRNFTIAGPSQQNPNDRSQHYTPIHSLNHVSSLLNPPDKRVRSLSVQLKPARALKQTIQQALCDSGTPFAQIHVDEQGLNITVKKVEKGSTSNNSLSSSASDLINSHNTLTIYQLDVCRRPSTEPIVVNLAAVSRGLRYVHDDDTLTLYQVDGSNILSIMCESSYPRSGLSLNFHPNLSVGRNLSFSFQLRSAGMLKRALQVLCDSEVNKLGLAYIYADVKGFQITVDTNEDCTAVLLLPPSMLRGFRCDKVSPVAQIVNLAEISWNLAPVGDEDTVTVYQVEGSNQLSFMIIVACPSVQLSVTMFSTNVYNFPGNIGKLPQIVTYCEGRVRSLHLTWLLHNFSQKAVDRHPVVAVEIEDNNTEIEDNNTELVSMDMGNWNADFRRFMDVEKGNTRGQKYRAWFHSNFTSALMTACVVLGDMSAEVLVHMSAEELGDRSAEVQVRFSTVPAGHVVFQFNPKESGHLMILKRALAMYPGADNMERLSTKFQRFNVM